MYLPLTRMPGDIILIAAALRWRWCHREVSLQPPRYE